MDKKIVKKYPVYIVSKGRWEKPLTANLFMQYGIDFYIVIEPQEYDLYKKTIPEKYLLPLPFSNLGLGSFPARNFIWEHSKSKGFKRHWIFDDNIRKMRRFHKGKRIEVHPLVALKVLEDFSDRYLNVGVSGFNYSTFVTKKTQKPFYLNVHVYSAILINNDIPFRWRLKYNEDVDLCLQVLNTKKLCTILLNTFLVDKTSTTAKMKR